MKRLEISKLMDEYQDDEFFPEGGSAADVETVKARVLEQARMAAPAKQKMPRRKKLLLAGALAAVLAVLVGAGFPSKLYQLGTGSVEFYRDADSKTIRYEGGTIPLVVEDGRLFYVLDGEHIDAAELMDEDTPYIRDLSDPGEDMICYLIMGGTPENYGWFQWLSVPNPFDEDDGVSIAQEDGRVYTYHFSFTTQVDGEPYRSGGGGNGAPDWAMFGDFKAVDEAHFRWLRAGAEELGIPFIDTTGESKTIIREE